MNLLVISAILLLVSPIISLNIVLSSTDSWVSKNVRLLHQSLVNQNHTVILIAPLYNSYKEDFSNLEETISKRDTLSSDEISDGGEFGHLLPVHQTYYKNVRKLNHLPRGAKNVISKKELDMFEEEYFSSKKISGKQYGQDPLDDSIWHVNSSPLTCLLVGLDVILPTYYPGFKPDLIIVGPNEGSSLTSNWDEEFDLQSMLRLSMIKNVPSIGISTEDSHHIYFQDENYFNIQQKKFEDVFKKNIFSKNIKFINYRINQLIKKISLTEIPSMTSFNVNFPSINHDNSHCFTSLNDNNNPKFKQVIYNHHSQQTTAIKLPKYELISQVIKVTGDYEIPLDSKQEEGSLSKRSLDEDVSTFVDKRSYYYLQTVKNYAKSTLAAIEIDTQGELIEKRNNKDPVQDISDNDDVNQLIMNSDEKKFLVDCKISITVNHLTKGNGLGREFFDINSLFE